MSGIRRSLRSGTLVLALIAFAAALFAAGLPGLISMSQTSSLRQTMAQAAAMNRTVTAEQVDAPMSAPGVPGVPSISALQSALDQFAQAVPSSANPQPSQAWDSETTEKAIPGGRAADALPSSWTFSVRPQFDAHAKLIAGTMPTTFWPTGQNQLDLDVALTPATATVFAAHVGSTISFTTRGQQLVRLHVTGLFTPTDQSSSFWQQNPTIYTPGETLGTQVASVPIWFVGAIVGNGESGALGLINGSGGVNAVTAQYVVPLDTSTYTAGSAGQIVNDLTQFSTGAAAAELSVNVTSGPLNEMPTFQTMRQAVDGVLSIVLAGVAAVAAITLLMAVRLVVDRRRAEYALLRARGQSLFQLTCRATVAHAPPGLVAVGIAAAAVRALLPSYSRTASATDLLIGICVVCLVAPGAIAVSANRRIGTGSQRGDIVRRKRSARSLVLEAVLVLCVAGAVAALRGQGIGNGDGRSNTLGSTVPILTAAVGTAVAVHLYPMLLRPAARATARRRGAAGFLGAAGASRSGVVVMLPAFIITLTLTLAAMGAVMYDTVAAGRDSASWVQVGSDADFRITWTNTTSWTPSAGWLPQLKSIRGVTGVTPISSQNVVNAPNGAPGVVGFAIDPQSYAAVSADGPWPLDPALLAKPASAGAPVPVIASPSTGVTVGQTFMFQPAEGPGFEAKVVAVQADTATARGVDCFLLPDWATAGAPQDWDDTDFLMSGSGIDESALSALVQKLAPGSTVYYRDQAISQAASQPLEHLAQDGYLFGVFAAICFGLCAVLLSLALTSAARNRRLLLLTMLGLTPREARRIAWVETSPLAVTAAFGGLLTAVGLPAVIGSSLNLTAFTGLAAQGPMVSDLSVPLLAALGAVALTALAAAVQAAAARRRRSATVLRIGTGDES